MKINAYEYHISGKEPEKYKLASRNTTSYTDQFNRWSKQNTLQYSRYLC
jgi:hypothetical protein